MRACARARVCACASASSSATCDVKLELATPPGHVTGSSSANALAGMSSPETHPDQQPSWDTCQANAECRQGSRAVCEAAVPVLC